MDLTKEEKKIVNNVRETIINRGGWKNRLRPIYKKIAKQAKQEYDEYLLYEVPYGKPKKSYSHIYKIIETEILNGYIRTDYGNFRMRILVRLFSGLEVRD